MVGPEFEVFKDYAGVYRWRLRAGNEQVIAVSGEGYVNVASAKEAISDVKRMAPEAPIHQTS